MESIKYDLKFIKEMRSQIQELHDHIQGVLKNSGMGRSRELEKSMTKLEEAKMWLGKELGMLGGEDLNAKRDAEEMKA